MDEERGDTAPGNGRKQDHDRARHPSRGCQQQAAAGYRRPSEDHNGRPGGDIGAGGQAVAGPR